MKTFKEQSERFWEEEALPALVEFGTIPNVSPAYDPMWKKNGHMERAATYLADWIRTRPVKPTISIQQLQNRTPLLFCEINPSGSETILIYGHFDKQPDMPGWRDGLSAWNPVREGDYLYGRGLADDGYAVFAALGAIEAAMNSGASLPRIILLLEGSEESGSEDLPAYLELLKDEIGTPSVVITLDAEGRDVNHLWLTETLRGLVNGTLHIQTLTAPMHSGLATGIVPSAFRIARMLLARIEDTETGILQNATVNPPIPSEVRPRINSLAAAVGEHFLSAYDLPTSLRTVETTTEGSIERNLFSAGLEITGFDGLPPPERAGNVMTASLTLKLSLCIPPWAECSEVARTLKHILEDNPPYGARVEYTAHEMDNGWVAKSLSKRTADALATASQETYGDAPVRSGIGASIPFIGMMGRAYPTADQIVTGILVPSSNAHGPNENLYLPQVVKLTEWMARFLTKL